MKLKRSTVVFLTLFLVFSVAVTWMVFATLQRNVRRLEERNAELETKLAACEKGWRAKMDAKEVEVVEVKARARQELGEQVAALRKENAALRVASSEAAAKL